MVFSVLRLLDGSKVEVVVFFPSGKRRSVYSIADYEPSLQKLLRESYGVLCQSGWIRKPLTEQQFKEVITNG